MSETSFLAAVSFLIFASISGALIQWLVSKVKAYKPPVSILWFLFGMLICVVEVLVVPEIHDSSTQVHVEINPEHPLGLLGIGIAEAARVHSSVLYYVVLPILLYDATQQISWHHFRKGLRVGLLLAIGGVMFQVLVVGLLMQYSFSRASNKMRSLSLMAALNLESSDMTYNNASLMTWNSSLPPMDQLLPLEMQQEPSLDQSVTDLSTNQHTWTPRFLGFLWKGPHVQHGGHSEKHQRMSSPMPSPSMSFSMMTASAVASTDPIAVLSILEEMEAPAKFGSLFDSEALINDGSSIFLFTFFKSLTRGNTQTVGESVGRFATLLLVGPLFGLIVSSLMYRWLKHYRWFPYDKTLAVVFGSYLVFFVAEIYLETSGPLAIVVYGLYFKAYAKAAFEAEAADVHYHFVRGCATAATSVVFIMSGIASARMMWDAFTAQANLALPEDLPELVPEGAKDFTGGRGQPSAELWQVPVFYLYLNAARFLMIACFFPLLRRWLGDFSWKEYILLSWGGLRGAVCLILALLIEQDEHIDRNLSASAALYIASSAFFVLLVNGITFEFLYKLLKPYKANPFKQVYLKKVMKLVDREYFNEVALLQQHWLFENSWALVYADRLVPRLGQVEMSELGKIHLALPSTNKILRDFDDTQLIRALPRPLDVCEETLPAESAAATDQTTIHITEADDFQQRVGDGPMTSNLLRPGSSLVGASSPKPPLRENSRTLGRIDEDGAAGHSTAAVLQRLRRPPESSLDLEMNLRLLDHDEEDDPTQVEELISRQPSKGLEPSLGMRPCIQSRSPSEVEEAQTVPMASPEPTAFPLKAISVTPNMDISRAGPPLPPSSNRRTVRLVAKPEKRHANDTQSSTHESTPLKRIPGYRYDSVVRIRSEPYNGLLDAAQLERFMNQEHQGNTPESTDPLHHRVSMSVGDIGHDGSSVGPSPLAASPVAGIPRTMSVPNHLADVHKDLGGFEQFNEVEDYAKITSVPSPVRAKDREGEILIMVINTMKQLYKRMYEQSFISGTVYIGFMATADVVIDFALVNVKQKSQIKAWREVFAAHGRFAYRGTGAELDNLSKVADDLANSNEQTCFKSVWSRRHKERNEKVSEILENITGFEVEWILTAARIRKNGPTRACKRLVNLFRKLCCSFCCRRKRQPYSTSLSSFVTARRMPRWQRMLQAMWTSLWSALGPRQTFPALDDLQLVCAFVDVHDELLLRGDSGLRTMLGPRLLESYHQQTEKAKQTILRLAETYPDSFPYAMICHAALFLVNLKIQLVEEQYERGLLLADDKETIASLLKQQLVSITKFHPPFLFS